MKFKFKQILTNFLSFHAYELYTYKKWRIRKSSKSKWLKEEKWMKTKFKWLKEWTKLCVPNCLLGTHEKKKKGRVWYLTIISIFFLYLTSILGRYSGRINMAAKLKEECFKPARWHSITVEVNIGTMSTKGKCHRLENIENYKTRNISLHHGVIK